MSIEVHRKAEFNIYNNFILLLVFFSQLPTYLKRRIIKGGILKLSLADLVNNFLYSGLNKLFSQ